MNREYIEDAFGLAVTFGMLNVGETKTVESVMMGQNPIKNQRASAKPTSTYGFNVDRLLENITELSGYTTNGQSGRRMVVKGREFLSVPAPHTYKQIRELCTESLKKYRSTIHRNDFVSLNSISSVKNQNVIEDYNVRLLDAIQSGSTSEISLVDFTHVNDDAS
ncbi:MAG: hypothetical protein GWP27_01145, partial [Bacteroidetes bacterium]|nr:hypothetical protein [Bacteroidota bacterium]